MQGVLPRKLSQSSNKVAGTQGHSTSASLFASQNQASLLQQMQMYNYESTSQAKSQSRDPAHKKTPQRTTNGKSGSLFTKPVRPSSRGKATVFGGGVLN